MTKGARVIRGSLVAAGLAAGLAVIGALRVADNTRQDEQRQARTARAMATRHPDATALSLRALTVNRDMTRREVTKLLGPPGRVVRRGDPDEWAKTLNVVNAEGHDIESRLYWSNLPCLPIVVSFDSWGRVIGWDAGRVGCDGSRTDDAMPGEEYACTRPERAELCR